jgi:hypothetical protein
MLLGNLALLDGLIDCGVLGWQRLVDVSFCKPAGEAFSELSDKFMITHGDAVAPAGLPGTTLTQSCFDPSGVCTGEVLILFQTKQ